MDLAHRGTVQCKPQAAKTHFGGFGDFWKPSCASIDLILALFDDIYLDFDDSEWILGKKWKFQKLEPKNHKI